MSKEKHIYCAATNKYYRKVFTEVYTEMAKYQKKLENAHAVAESKYDDSLVDRLNKKTRWAIELRNKGVVLLEIKPEDVPSGTKLIRYSDIQSLNKHTIISFSGSEEPESSACG